MPKIILFCIFFTGIQGLAGSQGERGLPGLPGGPGIPGMRGLRGVHGEAGQSGKPGNDGQPGVQGLQVNTNNKFSVPLHDKYQWFSDQFSVHWDAMRHFITVMKIAFFKNVSDEM